MNNVATLIARVAAARVERARVDAAVSRRYAPNFNSVALLFPDELRLSEAFRWLLDETETHGQGGIFRDLFISDLLGDAANDWSGAKVRCEVSTADRLGRIDILIVSQDEQRCAAIENKPWAGWQANQLPRYLNDQIVQRRDVRVHALIGGRDAQLELERHWKQSNVGTLPSAVTASSFDEVAAWLDACSFHAQPETVRNFLFDLAAYCRTFILKEPSLTEVGDTADLILSGGEEALGAARSIAAALPWALTREVARRLGGRAEMIRNLPALAWELRGVRLHFVLFGDVTPWAGVRDESQRPLLRGNIMWDKPEKAWPRWAYLRKVGDEGRSLAQAAALSDPEAVTRLIPVVADQLIGVPTAIADEPPQ